VVDILPPSEAAALSMRRALAGAFLRFFAMSRPRS
jgi:hypothetical protein